MNKEELFNDWQSDNWSDLCDEFIKENNLSEQFETYCKERFKER
jgi:hypothetical protein